MSTEKTVEKRKYWRTVKEMTAALAVGCIQADEWFPGWVPSPELQQVLSDFAAHLNGIADKNGMLEVENTYEAFRAFVHEHAACKAWNQIGNPPDLVFTSRYDPPATERQFIDLDAIVQNARAFIRREDEVMDRCDINVAKDHPDWPISLPEPA